MSDLSDFFAKKDRKKKKAAARSALPTVAEEGVKLTESSAEAATRVNVTPPAPKQPDDGWIEIEDPKGAQVNTGGRTVMEFKRDADDKEHNGEGNIPTEKFSGWAKTDIEEPEAAEGTEVEANIAKAPSTAFPSLADAANAPQVPVSRGKSSSTSTYASAPGRPRFINTNAEKLRKKLAERAGAPANK